MGRRRLDPLTSAHGEGALWKGREKGRAVPDGRGWGRGKKVRVRRESVCMCVCVRRKRGVRSLHNTAEIGSVRDANDQWRRKRVEGEERGGRVR